MCQFTPDCNGRMIQGACSDCGAHPRTWGERRASNPGLRRVRSDGMVAEDYDREMEKIRQKAGK